jgi:glycolate oxidase FAD binding subunit
VVLQDIRERIVAANRAAAPLRLRGSGTKDFYAEDLVGEVLDLSGYRGIVDYEPTELVITARAGTPLSEIETALSAQGQFLAFEPPGFGADPTLGGVIASGLSGPRRMQAGAARDFVLGAKLLNAGAEELRFGGQVMKNVAGFDVSRLLCGSLGILGVITEVSLKVLPRPRCEETLRLTLSASDAVDVFNRLGSLPLPISAATWVDGSAWIRLSGAPSAIKTARERIGGDLVEAAVAASFWNRLRHFELPVFNTPSLWRLSVPSAAPPLSLSSPALIDWGGSLRWYIDEAGRDIRAIASAAGGTALRWRGETSESRFHPLSSTVADIHRRLKQRFDPRGIFNRGRLLRGL